MSTPTPMPTPASTSTVSFVQLGRRPRTTPALLGVAALIALCAQAASVQAAAPPTSAPPTSAGEQTPPPQVVGDELSLTGSAVWEALRGQKIVIGLDEGASIVGTVVAHDGHSVALARSSDGMVVSVPKAEVLRVATAAVGPVAVELPREIGQRPLDDGRRAHAVGAVLLSFGIPLGISGTVFLGICPSCAYLHLPQLLPGIGMIIGGSIAFRRASRKRAAFNEAWGIPLSARVRLVPQLGMSRQGGELGFTLRF